jgi:hypothetical protein
MDIATVVVLALVALLIVGAAVFYMQRRRSQQMRSRYGAEYIAAVDETGNRRKAESELRQREKRVEAFDLQPLPPREAAEFAERWRRVQAEFVDDPRGSIDHADALLGELMQARGYPVGEFEQRAADLSVHHPRLVSDYRIAHDVARRSDAGAEDLRKAMIHYRALFEDLLAPTAQDRRPDEARTFTPEEAHDERATRAHDERGERGSDDRAARQRRRAEPGDGRTPRV